MKLNGSVLSKGWLTVIPLLFVSVIINAQPIRFSGFYDSNNGAGLLEAAIVLDNGNIMAAGSNLNLNNSSLSDAHHVVIDGEGNLISEVDVTFSGMTFNTQSLIRTGSGGLFTSGYHCDYTVESPGPCDFYFARLDETGDTLFTRIIERPDTSDLLLSMVETRPNKIMLIGWTYDDTTDTDADILLITVDTLGNELNRVVYGGGGTDYIHSGTTINEQGEVLMTGGTKSFGGSDYDTWLIKTDSIGNVLWQETYNSISPGGGGGTKVFPLTDGNYAIVGGVENMSTGNSDALIMKVDPLGNEIWIKEHVAPIGSHSFWSGAALSNGAIIGVGQTTNTDDGSQAGWLMKTDANGDTLWTHTYNPSGSTDLLRNMMLMPNGDIVMVGFGRGANSTTQDGWILRVDSLGCEVENCFITGVEELPFGSAQGTLEVYPNPFTNSTTIAYDLGKECELGCVLRLYDLHGRVLLEEMLSLQDGKGQFEVDMSRYTNGIYYCSLYGNKQLLQTEKLILMR